MSYTAFETEDGKAMILLSALCRHMLKNTSQFDNETVPNRAVVEMAITDRYSMMALVLNRYGIAAAQTDSNIIRVLQHFQVFCTVDDLESMLPGAGANRTSNPRQKGFSSKWAEFEQYIRNGSIQSMENCVFATSSNQAPEFTGSSVERKDIIAADTDRITPDITRDMMKSSRADNGNGTNSNVL